MHGSSCPSCGAASDGTAKSCGSCGAVSSPFSPLRLTSLPSHPIARRDEHPQQKT
ncbi:hypothetical protein C8A05DRAFT_14205 [Staphylotrichum tortipilum]|uniref:Uncharacterized protein n=1 Tax=Staphylotrichum tortipilum TaxID=2831512 RepID=A0AAN6MMX0_9PEZI|nr:hypothetical protein C8A05DRAFT_14205 [Staphylotrichum longicolle]